MRSNAELDINDRAGGVLTRLFRSDKFQSRRWNGTNCDCLVASFGRPSSTTSQGSCAGVQISAKDTAGASFGTLRNDKLAPEAVVSLFLFLGFGPAGVHEAALCQTVVCKRWGLPASIPRANCHSPFRTLFCVGIVCETCGRKPALATVSARQVWAGCAGKSRCCTLFWRTRWPTFCLLCFFRCACGRALFTQCFLRCGGTSLIRRRWVAQGVRIETALLMCQSIGVCVCVCVCLAKKGLRRK